MNPLLPRPRRRRAATFGLLGAILAGTGLLGGRFLRQRSNACGPGEVRIEGRCTSQRLVQGGKVLLNAASIDELAQIPGIGRSTAEAIVAERTRRGKFDSFEQLDTVPGVGTTRLQSLRAYCLLQ